MPDASHLVTPRRQNGMLRPELQRFLLVAAATICAAWALCAVPSYAGATRPAAPETLVRAATPRPVVSLETSATNVSAGATVTLAGTVAPQVDGVTSVAILQRAGARWRTAGTAGLAEDGTFAVTVTAGRPGTWQLLAQYKAGKAKVRSAVLSLQVRAVPSAWATASAGAWGVVALAQDGTLWAWGDNRAGEVGGGTPDEDPHATPSLVSADTRWMAVAAGEDHALALKSDGTLWAWGDETEGQLGLGEATATVAAPVQVGSGHRWTAVAAGSSFSLALQEDGSLWSWGANANGQLGLGDTRARRTPTRVGESRAWHSVAAGRNQAAAVAADGTLSTWGFNGNGQLGLGDTASRFTPIPVRSEVGGWRQVSCGNGFTSGVSSAGGLFVWGYDGNGQLGLGDSATRDLPTRVGTRGDWSFAACGGHHTLARTKDGTLWTWGWNGLGQLGLGSTADVMTPAQVRSDADWADAWAGPGFSLGLDHNGVLWAWGENDHGQLGLGDTDPRSEPAVVGGGRP